MHDVTELLKELASLQVKLCEDQGELKVTAPKGVMSEAIRHSIVGNKAELVRILRGAQALDLEQSLRSVSSPELDHLPFAMADLQLGFYVADDQHMEFHVRPHCYMETDHSELELVDYEAAWNRALQRHLRELCTVTTDGQLELLADFKPVKIAVYDLRQQAGPDVARVLDSVRQEMQRSELPLDVWPWFDLRVSIRIEDGREVSRVHYNHNNYFIDGFGTNLLLAEIDGYYRDPSLSLPPLELSYRDAVLGLERLSTSAQGETAWKYWLDRLPDLPLPPNLPMKPGVNRRSRSQLFRREGFLCADRWNDFKARSQAHGITPSNAITTAYAHVLATWSNSDNFIVSQMMTRRMAELHPDMLSMLGNFVSLYPLEIRLQPALSFAQNALAIQSQVLSDLRHLQIGGMRVMQELNRLNGSFGSAPSPFVVGSGLFLKQLKAADFTVLETCQTLLDHQFFELQDGRYHFVWDVLENFFPSGVVDSMWESFCTLLGQLADSNEPWLHGHVDLVPGHDLANRMRCNLTSAALGVGRLHDSIPAKSETRPDAPALVHEHGTLDYAQLGQWSHLVSHRLVAAGVARGDRVAIAMNRTPELLASVMGILQTGAAYVPLDPGWPMDRMHALLRDTGVTVVLTHSSLERSMDWPDGMTVLGIAPKIETIHAMAPELAQDVSTPDDLAYVIYTSGSTGVPKGVMIDHRGALNTIRDINTRFQVSSADTIFGVSAFSFDLSVYDIFGAADAGACLVFPSPALALDPAHWVELLEEKAVTIWNSVPALFQLLAESAHRSRKIFPLLRLIMLSGDKIPLELPAAIASMAPNASVVSLGGATEASIWSIIFPISGIDPLWQTIPYGYPLANQSWHVMDRYGYPCPTWVPGDLYIGGVGLALGYWNDATKTAASFVPDRVDGKRVYRTGDLGRYDADACIEWLGRSDSQVKVQGHRIELGEIEATLLDHPGVRHCVVSAPDENGQRRRLVAHLVHETATSVENHDLESYLRERLPAYMVPTAWQEWAQFPLSANGKIDRRQLDKASRFEDKPRTGMGVLELPATAAEATLRSIWQQVLKLDNIGVTQDFFDIGGQSFDAIRIFSLVKERFQKTFTLVDIWRNRTIRALASALKEGADSQAARTVVRINRQQTGVPLYVVHPAGGSVLGYAALGQALSRPLFGLQCVQGSDELRTDIRLLAASYVAALREAGVRDRFSLAGWSTGAVIAFEMAAQIEAAGDQVVELLLLDGPTPLLRSRIDDKEMFRWFLDDLALDLPVERLEGQALVGLSTQEQLHKAGALVGLFEASMLKPHELLSSFEIFRDLVIASSHYRAPVLKADLRIIRVTIDVVDEFSAHPFLHGDDWGWRAHTTGTVSCFRVEGSHHTFLSQGLVERWASLADALSPGPMAGLSPAPSRLTTEVSGN